MAQKEEWELWRPHSWDRSKDPRFGSLAAMRSPTERQMYVTFHRIENVADKPEFLWENFIIPNMKRMEEERGGGMKIFCTSDDRAEALKKVLSENEEIPETLKIETLTMAHHPRDRHLIAEKWNSGQCKMIIAYYGVGERRLLNPGGNMLYFDFPYGGEQLAATYNYTFEKQSDIFYCQESDRQYLPGLIKEWRMFKLGNLSWLTDWIASRQRTWKRHVPIV